MYYTYVLQSQHHGRYYIGSTVDLANRLSEHNAGKSLATRNGIPWVVVHSEEFLSLREARQRERQIKSWKNPQYMARKLFLNNPAGERPD